MSYQLSSPLMRGPGVKKLQKQLAGENPWKRNFHPGKIDGVYGPATASAVKRAKWRLGYPTKLINNVAGATFCKHMAGTAKLPLLYKRRGDARARRVQEQAARRAKALAGALANQGVKERPAGTNRCKYSEWYGLIGPWCAMFVTYHYVAAGSKAFLKGARWAYVPYILSAANGHDYGLSITTEPGPGDLVLFDWDKDGVPDHIGMFVKWNDKRKSSFTSIEGNTALGNDSNGGEVQKRTDRKRSQVKAFVRVSQ